MHPKFANFFQASTGSGRCWSTASSATSGRRVSSSIRPSGQRSAAHSTSRSRPFSTPPGCPSSRRTGASPRAARCSTASAESRSCSGAAVKATDSSSKRLCPKITLMSVQDGLGNKLYRLSFCAPVFCVSRHQHSRKACTFAGIRCSCSLGGIIFACLPTPASVNALTLLLPFGCTFLCKAV